MVWTDVEMNEAAEKLTRERERQLLKAENAWVLIGAVGIGLIGFVAIFWDFL